VTQGLSWHWVFWVNVPAGLAGAALPGLRLPQAPASGAALDLAGAVLASVGALAVIWSLAEAGGTGWDATNPGLMAGGLLALAAFLARERRAAAPMWSRSSSPGPASPWPFPPCRWPQWVPWPHRTWAPRRGCSPCASASAGPWPWPRPCSPPTGTPAPRPASTTASVPPCSRRPACPVLGSATALVARRARAKAAGPTSAGGQQEKTTAGAAAA